MTEQFYIYSTYSYIFFAGGGGNLCCVGSFPNNGNLLKVLISFLLMEGAEKKGSGKNFLKYSYAVLNTKLLSLVPEATGFFKKLS